MNFKPNFVKKEAQTGKLDQAKSYEPITKYMATDLVTFSPDTEIIEVIDAMLSFRFSGAPVLDENKRLVGLISEKDCLKVIIDSVYHNHPVTKGKVSRYMTKEVKTVSVEADIVDVANEFLKVNYRRFPVVDQSGKLVGQVSRRDILRAIKVMNITTWQKDFEKEGS